MGTREDITADATKCAGCGEPFVSGSGPYIRHSFVGMYHKRCLPLWPAPDLYRAGLIAGLRECAALADDQVAASKLERIGVPANSAANTGIISMSIGGETTAGHIAKAIRARIAALEEEGKS